MAQTVKFNFLIADLLYDVLLSKLDAKYQTYLPENYSQSVEKETDLKKACPKQDVSAELDKFRETVSKYGDDLLYLAFQKAISFVETHNSEDESKILSQSQCSGKGFKFYEM